MLAIAAVRDQVWYTMIYLGMFGGQEIRLGFAVLPWLLELRIAQQRRVWCLVFGVCVYPGGVCCLSTVVY